MVLSFFIYKAIELSIETDNLIKGSNYNYRVSRQVPGSEKLYVLLNEHIYEWFELNGV